MTARSSSARASTARPAPRTRPQPATARPRAARRPAPAPRARVRVRPAVVWVVLPAITMLLGGIVWINVAKLQLTRQSEAVTSRSNQLQSENIHLSAQVAQQTGSLTKIAGRKLGMLPGTGSNDKTSFLIPPTLRPLR